MSWKGAESLASRWKSIRANRFLRNHSWDVHQRGSTCSNVCVLITYSRPSTSWVWLPILLVISWTGIYFFSHPCSRLRVWSPLECGVIPLIVHTRANFGAYVRDIVLFFAFRCSSIKTAMRYQASPEFTRTRQTTVTPAQGPVVSYSGYRMDQLIMCTYSRLVLLHRVTRTVEPILIADKLHRVSIYPTFVLVSKTLIGLCVSPTHAYYTSLYQCWHMTLVCFCFYFVS